MKLYQSIFRCPLLLLNYLILAVMGFPFLKVCPGWKANLGSCWWFVHFLSVKQFLRSLGYCAPTSLLFGKLVLSIAYLRIKQNSFSSWREMLDFVIYPFHWKSLSPKSIQGIFPESLFTRPDKLHHYIDLYMLVRWPTNSLAFHCTAHFPKPNWLSEKVTSIFGESEFQWNG